MSLSVTFRSELLKTRRTSAIYLTVFGALIVPSIKLDELLTTTEPLAKMYTYPWEFYYENGLHIVIGLLLPLYIILISTLLTQIEYRNNTWKQVFSSPQSEFMVFISKFLSLQFLIISFLLLNAALLLVVVLLVNVINPELGLLQQAFDWRHLVEILLKTFFLSMTISSMQFWMSLRFRNFILPLALGLVLWFLGMMMIFEYKAMSKEWYPYSYLMMLILPKYAHLHTTLLWNALLFNSVFLIAGFIDFKYKKGKI
jgi:hypothetical protein